MCSTFVTMKINCCIAVRILYLRKHEGSKCSVSIFLLPYLSPTLTSYYSRPP